jgi:disulfide bond formation protein DsbB
MTTDAATLLFAILAVIAEAAVVGTVVVRLAAPRAFERLRQEVGPDALTLAFIVAAVATGGSLYLSEVAHFTPCRLCWFQRAAMYPLVPVLAVAAWRRATNVRRLAIPLAAIGATISAYHVLVERFPTLESDVCDPTNPCTAIWFERFGYLTIPAMALSAFALIITLLFLGTNADTDPDQRGQKS